MTLKKPDYFDEIYSEVKEIWAQLNDKPKLAGPWWQLFMQVKSIRHVISELLQNADDTEAIECSVKVTNNQFIFEHNGRDFTKSDFSSLCQFGYSNKRLLHTIGFRGIGFKSTFSLGDDVELITPTLHVNFNDKHFTLPEWLDETQSNHTVIKVNIKDVEKSDNLVKNVNEWIDSPFSLLFFNNIRKLDLDTHEIQWINVGQGPTHNSEWMELKGTGKKYLVIWSDDEPFPKEAINEIRQERLLTDKEVLTFPPCNIKIVLGAPGKLYIALPTLVNTSLPYAINAPFIPDPTRTRIKEPGSSITNKWLLERVGRLAASTMLEWLKNTKLSMEERAEAYELLQIHPKGEYSEEKACEDVVVKSFFDYLDGKADILLEDGSLGMDKNSVAVPSILWRVWTEDQIYQLLKRNGDARRLTSQAISDYNVHKLAETSSIEVLRPGDIQNILKWTNPPKPERWYSLLVLWAAVMTWETNPRKLNSFCIFPVRSENVLYSSDTVVRLGEKRLLQQEDDWVFLSQYLRVIDTNWLRFLTEQEGLADKNDDQPTRDLVGKAKFLLVFTEQGDTSNADDVINNVAEKFLADSQKKQTDIVRFTQIAAKLNANVNSSFKFLVRKGTLKKANDVVLYDGYGMIEKFIPETRRDELILDDCYVQNFTSCSKDDWDRWHTSGNAGTVNSILPTRRASDEWLDTKQEAINIIRKHGCKSEIVFPYNATSSFSFYDYDFPDEYWKYWYKCAAEQKTYWCDLVESFFINPKAVNYSKKPEMHQTSSNGWTKEINAPMPYPGWVLKLQELPCLRDTKGHPHKPGELMRRTPQTEPLLDVEPFVDGNLDTEATRQILDLLGVRSIPTGPKHIIERIQALSKSDAPPLGELSKWYDRLDQLFGDCSTEEQSRIRATFAKENLIFSAGGTMENSSTCYLAASEMDAPGAMVIHPSISRLSFWKRIGVNDRPSFELATRWLSTLPSGRKLDQADLRRVKGILPQFPQKIWYECEHWLNLLGEWVPVSQLKYSLSMQSLSRWGNLFDHVKSQTADLQMLNSDTVSSAPFTALQSLVSVIERKLGNKHGVTEDVELHWLHILGSLLARLKLEDVDKQEHIRAQAQRLLKTSGKKVTNIEILPYLEGTPAGTAERVDTAWVGEELYFTRISTPKLGKLIPETVAEPFDWPELKIILAYCYDRSDEKISEYMEANYRLAPATPVQDVASVHPGGAADTTKQGTGEPAGKTADQPTKPGPPAENPTPPSIPDDVEPQVEGATEPIQPTPPPVPVPEPEPVPVHPTRPPQPSLIERFAQLKGFVKTADDKFTHPEGYKLIKSEGIYPWEFTKADGTVLTYLWVKEHCLERKPLEIPSEVWNALEKSPAQYALLLEDYQGKPLLKAGGELVKLKQGGALTIHPAAYRLKLSLQE